MKANDNRLDKRFVVPPAVSPPAAAAYRSPTEPATMPTRIAAADLAAMQELAYQLDIPLSVFLRVCGLADQQ